MELEQTFELGYHQTLVTTKTEAKDEEQLKKDINALISAKIGPIAKLDKIQFTSGLPKTRSGKIMRRILRKIAEGNLSDFGDISTLLNPEVVEQIKHIHAKQIPGVVVFNMNTVWVAKKLYYILCSSPPFCVL